MLMDCGPLPNSATGTLPKSTGLALNERGSLVLAGALTVRLLVALPQVMVALPEARAVTVLPLTLATLLLLLLQVPSVAVPGVGVMLVVAPMARLLEPRVMPVSVLVVLGALTVRLAVALPQVMVTLPVARAVTVLPLMLATPALLLLQLPSVAVLGVALILVLSPIFNCVLPSVIAVNVGVLLGRVPLLYTGMLPSGQVRGLLA